ncbi:MAG: thioredoxin family protein [Candidatus Zixiibacteriota bacterium]
MLRDKIIAAVILALISLFFAQPLFAKIVRSDHVEVQLVSDQTSVQPGDTVTVGLLMTLENEWHLYWTNPGDAGLAPRIKWNLPDGAIAKPPQFPAPKRIPAGPLVSFGYDKELLLLSEIIIPVSTQPHQDFAISAEVDWLVCKVECIPGEAVLSINFPVVSDEPTTNTEWSKCFADVRNSAPVSDPAWNVAAQTSAGLLRLEVAKDPDASNSLPSEVFFFPDQKGIIENAVPQKMTATANGFELLIQRNNLNTDTIQSISGMLVSPQPWVAGDARKTLAFSAAVEPLANTNATAVTAAGADIGIWQAILFAFIGGLILNLMPCVLPVLSIKVLGFIQQAGESRRKVSAHNSVFTLGVLMSFWILAATLLLVRAGGEQLGWGFQLQSPAFIIILTSFMFLLGLNLLGVFEVGVSLTGIGSGSRRSGLLGSFLAGVTATVVATPCTAPFMGSALGFSLTQPTIVSIAIFTALGLGMAAPYVILTSSPFLLKFVPKPGRWMETLKHAMGFLLMATVLWLAWVLSIQTGADSILLLLATLLVLGIAGWIYGRWGNLAVARTKRSIAQFAAVVLVLGAISSAVLSSPSTMISNTAASSTDLDWEPFSPERVVEIQGQGKPLLIDFTAAWCLSCKVNERVAFSSKAVQDRLSQLAVVTMKADWTSRDARITRALASFERNSVPLYVLYSGKAGQQPILLPEILTPGIVLEALNKLEG